MAVATGLPVDFIFEILLMSPVTWQ